MGNDESTGGLSRRSFVRGSVAALALGPAGALVAPGVAGASEPATRWVGELWWANRLQDWARRGDRLECVAVAGHRQGRTLSALTWEVTAPSVVLRVRTGTLTSGTGFSGFVVGTGVTGDDWRARVLVGAASGTGGGFLATYESDGTVRFREHTDELDQLAYAELASRRSRPGGPRHTSEDVTLELAVSTLSGQPPRALLRAFDTATGRLLASASRALSEHETVGGVGLMSSDSGESGARYWFANLRLSGNGARHLPQRALGPVVGALFTVSESGLKMTAQLMPVDLDQVTKVWLQVRDGDSWRTVARAPVRPSYSATLTVPDWDSTRRQSYRVVAQGNPDRAYTGVVPAQPTGRDLVIASLSCVKATHRELDRPSDNTPRLAGERPLGLYTQDNVYFPHDRLTRGVWAHRPDLLVSHGDQLYEHSPTVRDRRNPRLDFLGKYLLWLWAFRDLTRCVPTVVLTDDHDVFQPNLWGASGVPNEYGDSRAGGYTESADWVNQVQQMVCGHNPDPFDPTPVEQGIGVYYTSFTYGGVSFAVLEDRKFKSGPDASDSGESEPQLLGTRQEEFLRAWAGQHPGLPKVVLSQTVYACLQTEADGTPCADDDSNGWPAAGRDRALGIIRSAGALMLAGDQHLGALVRHGIGPAGAGTPADAGMDGPLQFAPPAGSVSYQRWFEPGQLPATGGTPHTGRWVDGLGNPVDVLAVVQPRFTRADFQTVYPTRSGSFGDRFLKNEGYGVIRIDPVARSFVLECWRWDTDPTAPGATQYPGFPYASRFDEPVAPAPTA